MLIMLLIGTVHDDLRGPLQLKNILEKLQPKSIGIECSINVDPAYYRQRRERVLSIGKHLLRAYDMNFQLLAQESLATTYYEIVVPFMYTKNVIPIDIYCRGFSAPIQRARSDIATLLTELEPGTYNEMKQEYNEIRDSFYDDATTGMSPSTPAIEYQEHIKYLKDNYRQENSRETFMTRMITEQQPDIVILGYSHIFASKKYQDPVRRVYERLSIPYERVLLPKAL